MYCKFLDEISDDWVAEKLRCINFNELQVEREIYELFRSKCEVGTGQFTAVEFTKFLRWKGLAKSIPLFVKKYNNSGEVEVITEKLFTSKLRQYSYDDTKDNLRKKDIIFEIDLLFNHLQQLKYVGKAVASACLALCFPHICVTADYIVPGLLHNIYDENHNHNPLFKNPNTAQLLQQALIMNLNDSLSAYHARNIATLNYTIYVNEFWNIKETFRLIEKVRHIEASIWSFGICYFRKLPGYLDTQPIPFQYRPNPPRHGPFSKACPNEP
jgi:hypothetical protein